MPKSTKKSSRQCNVCSTNDSKYTCARCRKIVYCSVACYKQHIKTCDAPPSTVTTTTTTAAGEEPLDKITSNSDDDDDGLFLPTPPAPPLRPLTSLKWPYIPDQPSYPDPLKRDDPKQLQTHHYEAIATSPTIRAILSSSPGLPTLLKSIDSLRGSDRQHALQRALGVSISDLRDFSSASASASSSSLSLPEDVLALRKLAEAVDACVRGGRGEEEQQRSLGLDWDS